MVIINLVLLALNVYKIQSNTVSSERTANITNICRENNIQINCDLPKDIGASNQLLIKEYKYDYVKLQQLFFGSITDVQRTNDLNRIIFKKGNETLTIENSKVIFNCPKKDYAEYINSINSMLGKFSVERKSGEMVYYFQTFRGTPVFSNYICVDLSGDNMVITLNYSEISRPTTSRQNVIGADEAIYYVINQMADDISGPKSITGVEKGFYDSRTSLSEESAIPPVYAIYVNDKIYYVNAYNGKHYK